MKDPITCVLCKASFDGETRLRLHLRKEHDIDDRWKLAALLRRSRRISQLENVMRNGTRLDGPVHIRRATRVGNSSLAITIPFEIVAFLRISPGDNLMLSVMNGGEFRVRTIDRTLLALSEKGPTTEATP